MSSIGYGYNRHITPSGRVAIRHSSYAVTCGLRCLLGIRHVTGSNCHLVLGSLKTLCEGESKFPSSTEYCDFHKNKSFSADRSKNVAAAFSVCSHSKPRINA